MSDAALAGDPRGGRCPRRRRHVARVLSWTAVSLGVLILLSTVGAVLLVRHYEGQLTRVGLGPSQVGPSARAAQPDTENVLLVGSDTRSGVGGGFGSASQVSGQRSDAVILAHFPPAPQKPTLVSFPRDAYVTIPAYRDAQQRLRPAHEDKLNAAFALGGPALLASTIEQLTQLPVDHYVEVNFAGFERSVDALGGVTLCARTTRHDPSNGPMGGSDDFMRAGTHEDVSGAVALAFVRNRHDFQDGDIARIHNQQYFISQMINKAISRGTLTNPQRLNDFVTSVAKSLRVDDGLTVADMQELALRLRRPDAAHVRFVTLPFTTVYGSAAINGRRASVVLVDAPAARALFDELRGIGPSPQSPASPPPGASAAPRPPAPAAPQVSDLSCGA